MAGSPARVVEPCPDLDKLGVAGQGTQASFPFGFKWLSDRLEALCASVESINAASSARRLTTTPKELKPKP